MELRSILSLSIRCSAALKHKSEAFCPSSARYTYSAPEDLITSLTCFSGKDPQMKVMISYLQVTMRLRFYLYIPYSCLHA